MGRARVVSHTVLQARHVERALPPSLVVLLARSRGAFHGVFLAVPLAPSLGSTLGVSLTVGLGWDTNSRPCPRRERRQVHL